MNEMTHKSEYGTDSRIAREMLRLYTNVWVGTVVNVAGMQANEQACAVQLMKLGCQDTRTGLSTCPNSAELQMPRRAIDQASEGRNDEHA